MASDHAALTSPARFFEYSQCADPDVPALPFASFPASLHAPTGISAIAHLDLSGRLFRPGAARPVGPCTSPNLLASFVTVAPGASLYCGAAAACHAFFVLRGSGSAQARAPRGAAPAAPIPWSAGDLFTLPACDGVALEAAAAGAALYWVCDAPLLSWLGVAPAAPRFSPTLYTAAALREQLARVCADPAWRARNRNGVLLGTAATSDDDGALGLSTMTLSHTMWALYNALPARTVQRPHRHNSVALDLCVRAGANVFTLMAAEIDARGELVPPVTRADWVAGAVFVTPPGLWHSHHNEGDEDAIVLPVQDAGLHTYMRTLMITFAPPPPGKEAQTPPKEA